ncbi:hypothetical protein LX36DRAFT_313649 [Colletotrichum falcatum]|nr:hypothetical protein LX36DRAFT_313649 [Colletotrichum falcatum]
MGTKYVVSVRTSPPATGGPCQLTAAALHSPTLHPHTTTCKSPPPKKRLRTRKAHHARYIPERTTGWLWERRPSHNRPRSLACLNHPKCWAKSQFEQVLVFCSSVFPLSLATRWSTPNTFHRTLSKDSKYGSRPVGTARMPRYYYVVLFQQDSNGRPAYVQFPPSPPARPEYLLLSHHLILEPRNK